MLTPGINSYVTVAEADAYIGIFYAGEAATQWNELDEPAKELRLERACRLLDGLPFTGCKTVIGQALMFPRYPETEAPANIRYAQIEIALWPIRQEISDDDIVTASERATMQRQGVTSFSLGSLSESYGGASGAISQYPFMADETISILLQKYLNGGYAVV